MAKNLLTKEGLPDPRGSACDVNAFGRPQPLQIKDASTGHTEVQTFGQFHFPDPPVRGRTEEASHRSLEQTYGPPDELIRHILQQR